MRPDRLYLTDILDAADAIERFLAHLEMKNTSSLMSCIRPLYSKS